MHSTGPLPPLAALPAGFAEMMASGVSCIVSSCSPALRPSIMRAVGTQVVPGATEITVFLVRSQAHQLLQDIADTGRMAVVFSQPASHRTVQFKARQPRVRPACEADRPVLQRYLAAMEVELAQVDIGVPFARAMFSHELDDVVALDFVPEEAFDQSPGPKAGAAFCLPPNA